MMNKKIIIKIGVKMKYQIDKELKSISIYSGSMVGRLYPMVNFAYGFIKCKSDDYVMVKKYSTLDYDGAKLSTLVIEPRQYEGELPCIMFFPWRRIFDEGICCSLSDCKMVCP